MDGIEYEEYCTKILENSGWEVEENSTTGDQGVDLIASIEDLRVCIQCKCFAKARGNKAVQEIAASMLVAKLKKLLVSKIMYLCHSFFFKKKFHILAKTPYKLLASE